MDKSAAARRSLEQQQQQRSHHHHPPDASTLSNPGEDWTTKKIKSEPAEAPNSATSAAELGVLLHKMDELSRLVASQRSEIQGGDSIKKFGLEFRLEKWMEIPF